MTYLRLHKRQDSGKKAMRGTGKTKLGGKDPRWPERRRKESKKILRRIRMWKKINNK